MPKREVIYTTKITFTNEEYSALVHLYNQLSGLMDDAYPEVTEDGLQSLIDNLQATLDSLLIEK